MMNQQEKKYWEGISRGQNQPVPAGKSIKERLSFLDEAFHFVALAKGHRAPSLSAAINLYKKWNSLKK